MAQKKTTQKKRRKRKVKSTPQTPPVLTEVADVPVSKNLRNAKNRNVGTLSLAETDNSTEPETKESRKSRHRRRKKHPSRITTAPLLCFDTETTNHGELLELSIFDIQGRELYHQYFRPKAKTWPSDIHHITPEMVADCKRFIAHRAEISRILAGARFFVGCAISNDINNLRRHGIDLPMDRHTVFETQNWYWLLNDETDRKEKNQTGLAAMAKEYDVSFGETGPHSATADTRTTLEVFRRMVEQFERRFPSGETSDAFNTNLNEDNLIDALNDINARFTREYSEAMHIFHMRNAGGYISVHRRENGFSIKGCHDLPNGNENIVMSVPVGDRKRAEIELRNHFESLTVKGFTGIFNLTDDDFEYIRNYTNTVDPISFIASKRRHHRRHHRITKRAERFAKSDRKRKK